VPRRAEFPHHRREAHALELLRKPVQRLGALEVLSGVVRVHAERRQHLLLDQPLLLPMPHRSSNKEAHAVAAR
jgi:hypothetical protein